MRSKKAEACAQGPIGLSMQKKKHGLVKLMLLAQTCENGSWDLNAITSQTPIILCSTFAAP